VSLDDDMRGRVARYDDRREDWSVFACETELEPRFARSQRRYIGASGSVDHDDPSSITPTAFTMSIQTVPAGNRIPVHCHETEETFFVLDGDCTVNLIRDDETTTITLHRWDLVSIPAFVSHDVLNDGEKSLALQTLLSKTHPDRPQYQDERLRKLQAAAYTR
jgi:quercetin dioxygenase-like cupin family protein